MLYNIKNIVTFVYLIKICCYICNNYNVIG
jgi:hypothetical protein